ncbi:MAG: ATP-binding protein [Candidatus Mariimomonas ferrooxydans]
MELVSKELKDITGYLRISGILATLPERTSYARAKKLSYEEFLELILSDEFERRQARALNVRINKAGVANLASYDWDTTTQYDRELVKKLFNLSFIEKKQSVLLFGPTGVGKTVLARHLAFSALKAGHSVLFTRADKMFDKLKLSTIDGSHDRTLRYYLKYDLLVVDDFAIRSLSRDEADDLYELIIERHEIKSSIFTSARAPEEWQGLFPDPILGNSALDRLAHSSYQILMDGPSIRKQNSPK